MPNLSRNPNPSRNTVYHGPAVTKLSSVQPTSVRWLWPDRLALGKLTLLAGDPGLGKSYLTLDLAARVSSGTPFPGTPESANEPRGGGGSYRSFRGANRKPHKVILLSAEDDPADTIRPRLDAAGADCDNILLMRGIQMANQERSVNLREDIKHLRHLVESLAGECRLIVIDPISAYLGDDEGHSNTKVRNMLAPLAKLAQDFGVAVLAVTHLNKGGGAGPTNAIYRTMGSLAFTAAARTVHLVARDPDDEARGGDGQRRLMLPIKNNLGHDRTGWAFSLTTHEFIDPAGGDPDDYPTGRRKETKITWDPHPTQESADALLSRLSRTPSAAGSGGGVASPAMDEAIGFLREALSNGGQPINDLMGKANALGISKATIKRARHEAGVAVTREGGRHGRWVWSLNSSATLDQPKTDTDSAKEITPADGLLYRSEND
ncbi:MAG: AAA family ATPase [Planctomycetota bacterium]